jgi:hypothetical protein
VRRLLLFFCYFYALVVSTDSHSLLSNTCIGGHDHFSTYRLGEANTLEKPVQLYVKQMRG